MFYPADASGLRAAIEGYLADASAALSASSSMDKEGTAEDRGKVKAVLVPHAGYVYSAGAAAHAYKKLAGRKAGTVVIMCNAHATYFNGLALDGSDAWETPLGLVSVDRALGEKLVRDLGAAGFNSEAHARDHTLEVQLPFLQSALEGDFKILPVLFGQSDDKAHEALARALAQNLGENDVVVASTDLSHYPSYADAQRIDNATLEIIRSGDIEALEKHIAQIEAERVPGEETVICGPDGVKTLMRLAKIRNWQAQILKYLNSGDAAAGDKERVVGYGALAFFAKAGGPDGEISAAAGLDIGQQEALLDIARKTVETYATTGRVAQFDITDPRLEKPGGAFVTLHKRGGLRGCIGQIIPTGEPLWEVVRNMAVAAGSEDPRFNPVAKEELDDIEYEVSVLSAPERVSDWREIEPGKHGVIVRKGFRSGVFLPQVADETGWSREEFLGELCAQKAGLPPDSFKTDPEVRLEIFTAQVFGGK